MIHRCAWTAVTGIGFKPHPGLGRQMAERFEKDTLSVKDIKVILGCGLVQAYDLAKSGKFHVVKVGTAIKIPKDSFYKWYGESFNAGESVPQDDGWQNRALLAEAQNETLQRQVEALQSKLNCIAELVKEKAST